MSRKAYAILSGLAISGAILLAAIGRDETTIAALLGLAGTLAGRGK